MEPQVSRRDWSASVSPMLEGAPGTPLGWGMADTTREGAPCQSPLTAVTWK